MGVRLLGCQWLFGLLLQLRNPLDEAGPCCMDGRARGLSPYPAKGHAMRTDFGRPSSSMRFKA